MKYILNLDNVSLKVINIVGGKNASLGEMLQHLKKLKIKVPNGFAITTDGYYDFIKHNNLDKPIRELIENLKENDIIELRRTGLTIRQLIRNGVFPEQLKNEIQTKYRELSEIYGQAMTDVAVRSSATAEDLPDASFAGQQETYLNVRGSESILESVRNCFASLFTDRAVSYRNSFGYDHFDVGLSVCIQKMVRSDLSSSGVAFSLDTESGFKDVVMINGSYGLGELIVQGTISPDEFIVFKPLLEKGFSSIIEKKLGNKDQKMIYGEDHGKLTKIVSIDDEHRNNFCINDTQILEIAKWVTSIEKYYSELKGYWCPMDVEWAIDGLTNELYIVQARPETIHSRKKRDILTEYTINTENLKPIVKGSAVGDKITSGEVTIMYSLDGRDGSLDCSEFVEGSVLVTDMTDPDWEPIMKKASAIITNRGGRTCHAAIVAREMGLPAIVGTMNATEILKNNQKVTVSCGEGDVGFVYDGFIDYEKIETNLGDLPEISTPIMLNVASPEIAFKFSNLPNAGVGLAREEFIINNYIKAHPMAIDELLKVYKVMESYGLKRGEKGLEVYLMAELPSNIFMAEEFSEHVDGFSIGSNDLTQLVLGLDRDSALVSSIYDERNLAVKRAISHLIKIGKKTNTKVGICGQGPSDFPDFAEFLVEEGIDSISITPDSLLKTLKTLSKLKK